MIFKAVPEESQVCLEYSRLTLFLKFTHLGLNPDLHVSPKLVLLRPGAGTSFFVFIYLLIYFLSPSSELFPLHHTFVFPSTLKQVILVSESK